MPIVTRLVAGKKNPSRVNIYLDGKFALALSIDEVVKHGIKKGLELTEEEVSSYKQSDEDDYLYSKLLNFLSFRPRSIKEVRERLYKYGVTDKHVQTSFIDKLVDKKYLDDLSFAKWFVESRNTHRPRSIRALTFELMKKGINREIIQKVTKEIGDEATAIKAILDKKLGTPHKIDSETSQKITSYLARQGFTWGKIREVVKSWESE